MNSHAQVPTALVMEDRIRVFVASRPQPGVSLTGWVDLDIDRPDRMIGVSDRPVLDLGGAGSFDEHGIMPSSVLRDGDHVRLYYSGWCRLAGAAPYHNSTGLAVSENGGRTFRRQCIGPVLDRTPGEAYSATSPCVVRHEEEWHIFYSAGLGWLDIDGHQEHVYDIRHAISADGIDWRRTAEPSIAQTHPEEAITRPSIVKLQDGSWGMWFCYRGSRAFREAGDTYRIGYARSNDLWHWTRDDAAAGIGGSENGFDCQMIAYPCVVEAGKRMLMFYNGNGFGAGGFGWAEWRS